MRPQFDGYSRRAFLATATGASQARAQTQSAKPDHTLYNGSQFLRLVWADGVYSMEFGLRNGSERTVLATSRHLIQILRYSGSRIDSVFNVPLQSILKDRSGRERFSFWTGADELGNRWRVQTMISPSESGFLLRFEAQLLSGAAEGVSLRIAITPVSPPERSWSFAPGLLYGGNRADHIVTQPYPPRLSTAQVDALGVAEKAMRVTADVPRVDRSSGYRLDALAVDATAPEIGLWDASRRAGFFFGSQWATAAGLTGLSYIANPETGQHEMAYSVPGVRAVKYRHCRFVASGDKGAELTAGESLGLSCSLLPVAAEGIPDFLHQYRFARARHRAGQRTRCVMPLSEAWVRTEKLDNTVFWQETSSYYRCETKQDPGRLEMGWVDGMMRVYALLHSRNALSKRRARSTLAFILESGQAPTGLFWGRYAGGEWLPAGRRIDGLNFSARLPSHTTDTVHWGFKVLRFLEQSQSDRALVDKLKGVLLRATEALQKVWKGNGDLGWMLDPATGKIMWRGSANGALAVANLAVASSRFRRPDFLATAQEMAARYYRKFVEQGVTYGGPGDALLALDSESCSDLVEGFVTLYEFTKNALHLQWAVHAAELLSTWVVSANVRYPPGSRFERLGIQPMGAVMANQQNLVGTPGLCTDSGVSWFRLYRHTNDPFFLDLLSDIVRACPQMVVRDATLWGNMPEGAMTECLSMNDAMATFGDAYRGATIWPQTALKLAYVELPGVYVDSSGKRAFVFDHVDATIKGASLKVRNPTAYPAEVKIQFGVRRPIILTLAPGQTQVLPLAGERGRTGAHPEFTATSKESGVSQP